MPNIYGKTAKQEPSRSCFAHCLAAVVGRRRSARNAAATSKQSAHEEEGGATGGDALVPVALASRNAAKRKQRPQTFVDDDALQEIVAFVKKQRPSVVSTEEKLDILLLQAKLRHEHHTQQLVKKAAPPVAAETSSSKANNAAATMKKSRQFEGANATQRIAELLNRKKDLVARVWADYCNGLEIKAAARPAGNYAKKATLVPHTHAVVSSVHDFVLARRTDKLRVIARDVMNHLETAGFIHVDRSSPKATTSTLRSVNRFLNRIGYKRGAKRGVLSYTLRKENSLERDAFLVKMTSLLDEQREEKDGNNGSKRIVYVGESYMFEKYARDDSSVFDANDEQDLEAQAATPAATESVNGKRLCFIAAIVDANPQVSSEDERSEFDNAHLLQETLVIFEGGKKQTKDFRGMFYHNSFLNWLEALFAALRERGIENASIVMENSKHHRELPKGTPYKSMTKEQMQHACTELEIPFEKSELRSMLWEKLKRYIDENVKPVACELAAEHGHEIVFSPLRSHHAELQPIESVFAIVKREVGQHFENLNNEEIQKRIDDANTSLEQLMAHVTQLDDMDISEDDDDEEEDEEAETAGGAEDDESGDESTSGFDQHVV